MHLLAQIQLVTDEYASLARVIMAGFVGKRCQEGCPQDLFSVWIVLWDFQQHFVIY